MNETTEQLKQIVSEIPGEGGWWKGDGKAFLEIAQRLSEQKGKSWLQ